MLPVTRGEPALVTDERSEAQVGNVHVFGETPLRDEGLPALIALVPLVADGAQVLHPEPSVGEGGATDVAVEDKVGGVEVGVGVVGDESLAVVVGEDLEGGAAVDGAADLLHGLAVWGGHLHVSEERKKSSVVRNLKPCLICYLVSSLEWTFSKIDMTW